MIVRPGDVLVLTATEAITLDMAMRMQEEILNRLPGLADVVILDRVTSACTYRQQDE